MDRPGTDDEWRGWWGPNPPFHTPGFVMTTTLGRRWSSRVATSSTSSTAPEEVLERAREAAGLVDIMHLVQVPIVLGRGVRLRDGLEGLEHRYEVETVVSPTGVTHLTFTRWA